MGKEGDTSAIMERMNEYHKHYDESALISATPDAIFDFANDHSRFTSHMSQSSWMMGGGKMDISMDEAHGQRVGSHIRMGGKVFGIPIDLDEVVTEYQTPNHKVWETVGNPNLIIIGSYKMGFDIQPQGGASEFKVSIDYNLPDSKTRILGVLAGDWYAKWCVKQMLQGVTEHFLQK